ncbi:MAG: CBS domain-containing protein, partial [Candidatus Bathyarchaeia archaeon]
ECMSKPVKSVNGEVNIYDVVKEMNKYKIASLLVVDDNGRPIGIITERDILQRVIEESKSLEKTKAKDIMSSPIHYIGSKATVQEACELMVLFKLKRLIVIDENKPVGMITITDIIKKVLSLHESVLEDWEKSLINAWESF